jgi:hypothetical protein
MGTVLWTTPNTAVNILTTTQLNGLANNAVSALGPVMQNTAGMVYADVEYVSVGSFSPTGGPILVWLLRSIDGGATYEDGGSPVLPARLQNISIGVRAGSSISVRAGAPGVMLPPAYYRAIAQNLTGAALPTGSIVRMSTYTEAL